MLVRSTPTALMFFFLQIIQESIQVLLTQEPKRYFCTWPFNNGGVECCLILVQNLPWLFNWFETGWLWQYDSCHFHTHQDRNVWWPLYWFALTSHCSSICTPGCVSTGRERGYSFSKIDSNYRLITYCTNRMWILLSGSQPSGLQGQIKMFQTCPCAVSYCSITWLKVI